MMFLNLEVRSQSNYCCYCAIYLELRFIQIFVGTIVGTN
jgi:hypothetical protein